MSTGNKFEVKQEIKSGSSNVFISFKNAIADEEKGKTNTDLSPKTKSLLRGLSEDDSMAKYNLGKYFAKRYKKSQRNSDKIQSRYWFKESANQGNIRALYELAVIYSDSMRDICDDIEKYYDCHNKKELNAISRYILGNMIVKIEAELKQNSQIAENDKKSMESQLKIMKDKISGNFCSFSPAGVLLIDFAQIPKIQIKSTHDHFVAPKKEHFEVLNYEDAEGDEDKPMETLNQICKFVTLQLKKEEKELQGVQNNNGAENREDEKKTIPRGSQLPEKKKENPDDVNLLRGIIASQQTYIEKLEKELKQLKMQNETLVGKLEEYEPGARNNFAVDQTSSNSASNSSSFFSSSSPSKLPITNPLNSGPVDNVGEINKNGTGPSITGSFSTS